MLGWNTTLADLFRSSAREHGDRSALWVNESVLTYAELNDAASRLAAVLIAARRRRPARCALFVDRTRTAYIGILGALMAGMAYVPLNPRFPAERILRMVESSEPDAIIIDESGVDAARNILAHCSHPLAVVLPDSDSPPDWTARMSRHQFFCRADLERARPPSAYPPAHPREGAYLLFTSGSTGAPKGVLISHANALAYIANVHERYRPTPDDRFSQLFDYSFDLSVHDMFLCWSAGACLYSAPQNARLAPKEFIRRHQLTFWFSVPSTAAVMSRMRMLHAGDFPSLRWSLFCGEPLPARLARQWQEAAPDSIVENLYGPTEATIAFTAYRLPKAEAISATQSGTVPIGWPLPGQKVAIIDEEGAIVPDGEAGELCLGGPQVASGYWRAPDRTAERFVPPRDTSDGAHWYRTGDLARNTSRFGLLFLGRIDRQVKIRGYRVELAEIEHALREEAGTDTVGVIPWPVMDDGLTLGVVGFVSGSRISAGEIIERCRRRLPAYMTPSAVHELAEWPLNANGKTDYPALRAVVEDFDVERRQQRRTRDNLGRSDAEA